MKLSIITVNKNNAAGLEKTIASVAAQTFAGFEYLVIDGASDDGSVEVIKKYADKITYWVSEPDTGIYNGMNKGIRKAQGDYCLFLNSGDWLIAPETLENVFAEIGEIEHGGGINYDVYYSDCQCTDNSVVQYPKQIDINYLIQRGINHQNALIKRMLLVKYGYYDENIKITSDWEFFLYVNYHYHAHFKYITTKIAVYDVSGISGNRASRLAERETVYRNVFKDIADIIIKFVEYDSSVYAMIKHRYSNSGLVDLFLRVYLFVRRRILRQ